MPERPPPERVWAEAPPGVTFQIIVPSKSHPGRLYRIRRDREGAIHHEPGCEAWEFGHRLCSHVGRALNLADRPEQTFVADVIESWQGNGWEPADMQAFAVAVYQAALAARERRRTIEAAQIAQVVDHAMRHFETPEQEAPDAHD